MDKTPGKVHTVSIESSACNETFDVQYYLPKSYSDLYKYNVIITFDSQDFFKYGQIERLIEKLEKTEEIERTIIVGVPYPSVEWRKHYFNPNGEHHENFVTFVGRELNSFIDNHFSTLKMANSRLLMGESLAGSFSLSTALTYPNTFGQVLAFSPFVDDEFINRFKDNMNLINLNIYHTIGLEEDDFTTIMGEQADFLTPNRKLNAVLEEEPLEYEYKELEGGHIWKTWKPELKNVLLYFFQ
ncbi:esterase family protein [Jeotgalicoccus huakuii]|nr:esterase family protein [Jeotgalicoccus huakuii]